MPPSPTVEAQVKEILESLREEIRVWTYMMNSPGGYGIPLAALVLVSLLLGMATGRWWLAVGIGVGVALVILIYIVYKATMRTEAATAKYTRRCIETFGVTSKDRTKVIQLLKAWGKAGDAQADGLATTIAFQWTIDIKKLEDAQKEEEARQRQFERQDEDRS